ncbi:roadblock/LC7 domain-containing protein [Streptomyces graminilatus]|uniref:roadblock/LC7 domain-containing protein n=1 Tax=Streptomyces graminilatus TaxID=1464070 RepID=UPI000B1825A2|nr:roadblock/LC7 domain-containing protein [Streptomyces graminilatus]
MATTKNDLTWLLTDFVNRTTGAVSALVTSRDGMKVASLNHDRKGEADTLSAITSGLHSLALGTGRLLNGAGGVRQVIVELDGGHLFVQAAGEGALLTVLVGADGDVGQVSYEMTLLVKQVPQYLYVAPRSEPVAAGTTVQ